MKILPITFSILTICGFWRPPNMESFILKYVYNIYTSVMCFLIYSFTFSHMVDILVNASNFQELTENCFMLLSMLNVCCKMTNILYFRKNILELLDILRIDHCKARNELELKITEKYHRKARFVTLCYATLTETTCMLITARTFFAGFNGLLPFKSWIPYTISNHLIFWMTFFHQTIAHVVAANLQIANETLICGLMIQACSQLDLLKHRLIKISQTSVNSENPSQFSAAHINSPKVEITACIEHHRHIKKFCEKLNGTFNTIIFVQFTISSLVLCSSVFLLSKLTVGSVQFMSLSLYLSCMLYQIFLFCWYGNEVILQSADVGNAIYNMDWTSLDLNDRKDSLIMTLLTRKPIVFSSSFLFTLSIDSYCKILKTSYSVFNLLQRTSG